MKKNISIITYTCTKNYGGILQAYGLYRYLSDCGYNVNFIDYIPQRCNYNDKKQYTNLILRNSRIWGRNFFTKYIWQTLYFRQLKQDYLPFLHFIHGHARFTCKYYSENELENNPPKADVYITGSDQVWNSSFLDNEKIDEPYYLKFAKGKKISYASSFGVNYIPEKNKTEVHRYLKEYEHLSTRENSGQSILKDLNLKSDVVVDPTILSNVNVWKSMLHNVKENNYILLYQVKFNKDIYKMAKEVAKKCKKKLVVISMDYKDKRTVKKNLILCPAVEEWLSYINSSEYVITDSFHASVFSILFEKRFIVNSGVRHEMSSRILTLLEMINLQERELNGFYPDEAMEILQKNINWDIVREKLEEEQRKSRSWLINAIER